ncbi:Rap family tetratricopeptide repeat protein [Bacillus mobilis]|uniref:Rap family tetratricopeptide repeat protein n=1 Tax=Bacillus mobilis TaxID=2026190 RepID=UPI0011A16CB0|nr:Rap family tetratricopeptide repeat protein [Bacillus mobilis]
MIVAKGNAKITKLMNEWYKAMRSQKLLQAKNLREDVEKHLNEMDKDQTLLIYYSLLEYRYNLLINNTEQLIKPADHVEVSTIDMLNYYYYLFNAIHAMKIGQYSDAKDFYRKAETLLSLIPDELEEAEFNYQFALFNYYLFQPLNTITYGNKAKEIYSKEPGYEINVASCNNILGLASTSLKQYELAEEYFLTALDIATKQEQTQLSYMIRHNLGLLYSDQDMPQLAINYLSKSLQGSCKTMYLLAKEHMKLGNTNEATEYIEKGLQISDAQNNREYYHHLSILKAKIEHSPIEEYEKFIVEGIHFLQKEDLWHFVQKYADDLANKFYDEGNHSKVSEYFRVGYKAKIEMEKRSALK